MCGSWCSCDWPGYKAICGLRGGGESSGLVFVVGLTLAEFLAG